jgi:hypothetical protein
LCAQVRAAVARSRARGRLALVIVDHLRPHTSAGSKLVRQMRAELPEPLRLLSTPAYDPDVNRIEWLWRWSRREVTHPQQRTTFAALLEDSHEHFETLRQPPNLRPARCPHGKGIHPRARCVGTHVPCRSRLSHAAACPVGTSCRFLLTTTPPHPRRMYR